MINEKYFRFGKGHYLKAFFEGKTEDELLKYFAQKRKVKKGNKVVKESRLDAKSAQRIINKAKELGLIDVRIVNDITKEPNEDKHGQDI